MKKKITKHSFNQTKFKRKIGVFFLNSIFNKYINLLFEIIHLKK